MKEISNKKNYLLTIFSKSGGMILQALLGLVSVPISLNYWGAEKYGIIAVINSIIVYLSVSNIGLGSATAVLMGKNTSKRVKLRILKKSFFILGLVSIIALALFLFINIFYKEWILFLGKIPNHLKDDAYKSCFILAIFYFINQPMSILNTIYFGFNRQYVYDYFEIVFGIVNFLRLLIIVKLKLTMIQFVLVVGLCDFIYHTIRGIYGYFFILRKELRNDLEKSESNKEVNEVKSKTIIRTGIGFFLMGFASMIAWNSDNIVISNFLGVEYVPKFAITYKLFSLLFTVLGILNMSFLPILSKEIGNKNWEWINEKYNFLTILNLTFGGLFFLGGVSFFKDVLTFWVGGNNYAGILVIIFLGGYSYLLSITGLNSGVLNTFNYIKGLHFIYLLEASINVAISIFMSKYLGLGGIAMGTFIGGLVPCLVLPIILKKRSNKKIDINLKLYLYHFFILLLPSILLSTINNYFFSNIIVRWLLNSLICIGYLMFCYRLFTKEYKEKVVIVFLKILKKVGINWRGY